MSRESRPGEQGMILINVLLIVALASGVLALLIIAQDAGLQRATRVREVAVADAALRGGELSAIVALRRDLAVAPSTDNPGEPWAKIGDRAAKIDGGTFTLVVADAQAKFNLNALARDNVRAQDVMAQIAASLRLPADTAVRVGTLIRALGGIASLDQLGWAGLDADAIQRLATCVTTLPGAPKVNANTANEPLLAILLANPVAARQLVSLRARKGLLGPGDFILARAQLPPEIGFTSGLYWVRGRVVIGDTAREGTSLLIRRGAEVVAIGRWRGADTPRDAPPLP